MNDFSLWFSTGLQHILDKNSYDHICYVMVLSVMFHYKDWKKLLTLITAFTIGHSLTLALSVSNVVKISSSLIEILIPITILLTCIINIMQRKKEIKAVSINYFLALFFGLIHGLGFSYLLKSILGREQNMLGPLFSFNLGLETGQLVIVAVVLVISVFLNLMFKVKREHFVFFISSAVFGIAFMLLVERI